MTEPSTTPEPPFDEPAIVYKPFTTWGGLEQYVFELALVLDAPIYTPVHTVDVRHERADEVSIVEFRDRSWFDRLLSHVPVGAVTQFIEYEQFQIPTKHDAVITVGEPTKAVVHHPHQRRYHLLNMPPRWLYDLGPGRYDEVPAPGRFAKRLYQSLVRVYDTSTMARIGDVIVPSEVIGRRLETYYGRSPVATIHPPVRVDAYRNEPSEGYLLYIGRLTAAKRVHEIVDVLSDTDYRLKIAGTGPLEERLDRHAGDNVEVLGFVSEEEKRDLLARCDGLVFNSDREAFGIVPVEAFASGKPVVGINEGFTRYQIQSGVNGVPFDRGGLRRGVARLYEQDWDPDAIRETATRYDVSSFRRRWHELLSVQTEE